MGAIMRLLDLYCGEGLAAWGYWLSGRFSEIVGVDTADMSTRYSFDFIQRDALNLTYDFLLDFDFIHASPPCQAYSKITPDKSKHPRLISATHLMLAAAGKPFVIENVEGSGQELRPNLRLYGDDVGLPMRRARYFHLSEKPASNLRCSPGVNVSIDDQINPANDTHINVHGADYVRRADLIRAFGLSVIPEKRLKNLTMSGIEQGIPPAFTMRIAESLIPHKFMIG
jgi:DNA (cytosine-5)-methyltransferase 1